MTGLDTGCVFIIIIMTIANLELRYRFAEITAFGQRFAFKIVGFTDTGSVYDEAGDPFYNPRFGDYKISYGGGLVIAWNMNTIIHFYYGISKEDTSVSVNFNHSLD